MKIIFASNYFNHHQKSFSDAVFNYEQQFKFIETTEMEEGRKKMGWAVSVTPQYCCVFEENKKELTKMILDSDVLISGSAPNRFIFFRNFKRKLSFRYAERQFKCIPSFVKKIKLNIKWHCLYPSFSKTYLLCASAYTSADFSRAGVFRNRAYKWGYFPPFISYQIDELLDKKDHLKLLVCSRLIDLKRIDLVLNLSKRLLNDGYRFKMEIIGTGKNENEVRNFIIENHLENVVTLFGSMSPENVRRHMEQAGIFIFPSDRNEGWGAVLNEAMNSGCAVVASHAIGSVPYLIRDGNNGFVFESGNEDNLYQKILMLLQNTDLQKEAGKSAYFTIAEEWNADIAAERFLELSKHILSGEKHPDLYSSGPCSKAEIIEDNWYELQ